MWRCAGCGATEDHNCLQYETCDMERACLDCDHVYFGGVKCPSCGGAAEPLDLDDTYDESKQILELT